jgi:hypothetical protein
MEWNSGRLHNTTGMTTGAAHSLELLVEEFQSFVTFWAADLYSGGGGITRLSTLMVSTQQAQETNDMQMVISR